VLSPGDRVDRFEVEALLGEGGLARVYRVRHLTLGTRHALKVLTIRSPAVGRRLVREGQIQAKLSNPHLVTVSDVVEHDGYFGLVMEYVDGVALDGWLGRNGAMAVPEALDLFAQILSGVVTAHDAGVLHRDLKPGNILLSQGPSGTIAKVTDFGVARNLTAGAGETLQGDILGTPGYMAPEQVGEPGAVDPRADIFSLGAVLYCMVAGRPPFPLQGRHYSELLNDAALGRFVPLAEVAPGVPEEVRKVIEACLNPDPDQRPSDGRVLAEQLFGAASPQALRVAASSPLPALSLAGPISNPTLIPGGTLVSGSLSAGPSSLGRAVSSVGSVAPSTVGGGTVQPSGPIDSESLVPPRRDPRLRWGLLVVGVALALGWAGGLYLSRLSGQETPTSPSSAGLAQPAPVPSSPQGTEVRAAPMGSPAPPTGEPTDPGMPKDASPAPAPLPSVDVRAAPPSAPAPGPRSTETPVGAVEPTPPSPASEAPPPSSVEPEPAPASPEVADAGPEPDEPEAPPPPPPSYPPVAGEWSGRLDSTPATLTISGADGRISGKLVLMVGTSYRTYRLVGSLDPTGSFDLSDPEEGVRLRGRLEGRNLQGTLTAPDRKKPASLQVSLR
jgi:serine/threonine protein kinase